MSDNQFNWLAIMKLAVQGAKGAADDIGRVQDAVDELTSSEKLSQEESDKLSQSLNRLGKSAQTVNQTLSELGGRNYQNASTALDQLFSSREEEAKKFSSALRAQMQESQKAADQRVADASKAEAAEAKAAAKRISDAAKVEAAEKKLNESRSRLSDSTSTDDKLTSARKRLTQATEDQAVAEKNYQASKNVANAQGQVAAANALTEANNRLSRANSGLVSATNQVEAAQAKAASQGPALRYALYDVSTSAAVAGAALTALALVPASVSISMSRAFADVERTTEVTGNAADRLRNDFNELHKSIPVSWGALTDIGRIAGQMNIAAGSLAEFTSLVAKFSATADVTVEKSATAFGRLAQLLKVPANEMSNLGSSILNVGVNSVATDDQIINVSTNIAAMGAYAKLSAADVFGFSAALASLGTQPELARGTITRLFGQIEVAIGQGGDKLQNFANLAGITADEFKSKWGTAGGSTEVIQGLLAGLNRASEGGEGMFAVLQSIGITASRDIPTLARLAQNTDLVAQALNDARRGYEDNTALNEQYSVISSTVAEKINLLGNNFQQLVSSVGAASGALGGIIDIGIGVIQLLDRLVDNPIAATILGGVGAVAALGGALALLGAVITRIAGGYVGFASVVTRAQAAIRAKTAATQQDTAANIANAASTAAATKEVAGAIVATNGFKLAVKGLLASTGVGLALVALGSAVEFVSQAFEDSTDKAQRLVGPIAGLQDAIKQDTAEWKKSGEAIATHSIKLQGHGSEVDQSAALTKNWVGVQQQAASATDTTTQAIGGQVAALGQMSLEYLKASLASQDYIKEIANSEAQRGMLEQVGFSMSEALTRGLKNDGSLDSYISDIQSKLTELFRAGELSGNALDLSNLYASLDKLREGVNLTVSEALQVENALSLVGVAADETGGAIEDLSGSIKQLQDDLFGADRASLDMGSSLYSLGQSLAENGGMFDYFSEAGRGNMEALLKVLNAVTEQSGGDAAQTAANMQALYDNLVAGGNAPAAMLDFLAQKIATLRAQSGGKIVAPTISSLSAPVVNYGFQTKSADLAAKASGRAAKAANKEAKEREKANKAAAKAAQEAIKNVVTLTDYANDLSSVWSRAFDIRFSGAIAEDKITSLFQGMRKDAEDAADKIKDLQQTIRSLQADIGGLQSDLNLQQYFLKIAVDYGDSARAAVIQANIAKIEADLAGKRNDLDKATKDLQDTTASQNKTLEGNSEAAIKNRAQILDLVKSYQDQIKALADSGVGADELARKTEQLRQQFITQATQLGYSQNELAKYSAAFDDVRLAIDRVPKNVTVTANTNPAIQAFNEFQARALAATKTAMDQSVSNVNNGVGAMNRALGGIRPPQIPPITISTKIEPPSYQQLMTLQEQMRKLLNNPNYRIATGPGGQGGTTWFAEGGYTGSGGKYETAGIVHRGEYVFPKSQVDQSTGLPYASAMAAMMPRSYGNQYQTVNNMSSGNGIMELGPNSLHAIARAVSNVLMLDGKQVANSTTNQYAVQGRNGAY